MELPKQLQNKEFRFCLIRKQSKAPFEPEWQKMGYSFEDVKLKEWDFNYGVIGGYGNLRILDIDNIGLATLFQQKLKTFAVKTGGGGNHFYFISDYATNHVLINQLGELRASNYQVVGPGSIHPTGNKYEVLYDVPIQEISSKDLFELIKPYLREEQSKESIGTKGSDTSRSGLEYRKVLSLLKRGKSKEQIYEEMKIYSKWCSAPEAYRTLTYEKAEKFYKEKEEYKEEHQDYKTLTRRGQIEDFWKEQPFFYDKYNLFWLWDDENKKWIKSDEIEYLNRIQELQGAETIDSKAKNELITGFKQIGRLHLPQKIEKNWVQFKDKVYDVKTGECFESTPEYFATNPIPWKVGESEDTPTIDKLFCDWVNEENKDILYEIASYSISLDKFMQRIFALIGGGANGKGTFIKFLEKFLGEENIVASDLKNLSENRFETASLYRKLLCVMGEVSYDDLKNTNQIKKIAGEDMLRFEFKGKDGFSDKNTATCVCLTNSLPTTPDKSTGFYRKWLIVDFPNQFKELKKDLIENIPEIEFENFAKKCLRILKELYIKKEFTNEGDFDERAKRYEERSNPVMRFVELCCNETAGESITLRDFANSCNEYLKTKHLRIMTANQVGKVLRDEGFSVGKRKMDDISAVVVLNIEYKENYQNYYYYPIPNLELHKSINQKMGIFGSSGSNFDDEKTKKWAEGMKKLGFDEESIREALND